MDLILRLLGLQVVFSIGPAEQEASESYSLTTSDLSFGFTQPQEYYFTDDEE